MNQFFFKKLVKPKKNQYKSVNCGSHKCRFKNFNSSRDTVRRYDVITKYSSSSNQLWGKRCGALFKLLHVGAMKIINQRTELGLLNIFKVVFLAERLYAIK